MSFVRSHVLVIFFGLTLGLSTALAMVAASTGDNNITILSVLGPTLFAAILTAITKGRAGLRELFVAGTLRRVSWRWLAAALFTIPLIALAAIGLHSPFGGPPVGLRTTQWLPQVVVILVISLGEEYGWRGFALPRLQKNHGALVASLVLGAVWGVWHYPASLVGSGVPLEMPFYVFLLWVLPATVLMTWVFNHSRSVLLMILMHSAANATFNYLWLLPEFVGQIRTFWVFVGLLWGVTIVVVLRFGAARLVRGSAAARPTA